MFKIVKTKDYNLVTKALWNDMADLRADTEDELSHIEYDFDIVFDRLDDIEGDIRTIKTDLNREFTALWDSIFDDRRTQQLINKALLELTDDKRTDTKTKTNVSSSTRKVNGNTTKGASSKVKKSL